MDLENYESSCSPESTKTGRSDSPELESVDSPETDDGITDNSSTPSIFSRKGAVKERRDLLNTRLKVYEGERLKRKLPVDTQLLTVSQEELQVKKTTTRKNEKYG